MTDVQFIYIMSSYIIMFFVSIIVVAIVGIGELGEATPAIVVAFLGAPICVIILGIAIVVTIPLALGQCIHTQIPKIKDSIKARIIEMEK